MATRKRLGPIDDVRFNSEINTFTVGGEEKEEEEEEEEEEGNFVS